MKTRLSFLLSLLAMSLLLSPSCVSLKDMGKGSKATATLSKTKANNLTFNTLQINGKGKAQMPGQDFSLGISYKIEVENGKKIRIRISKLGLEGARILITPDSIIALDRLNKIAYCANLEMAKSYVGFDADFSMLQAMMIGDFYPIPQHLELETKNPLAYSGHAAGTDFLYYISSELLKMTGMEARNVEENLHTQLNYLDFSQEAGQQLATEGEVQVFSPEAASFSFKHNKVEIDPERISFAFKIPNSYEVVAN